MSPRPSTDQGLLKTYLLFLFYCVFAVFHKFGLKDSHFFHISLPKLPKSPSRDAWKSLVGGKEPSSWLVRRTSPFLDQQTGHSAFP